MLAGGTALAAGLPSTPLPPVPAPARVASWEKAGAGGQPSAHREPRQGGFGGLFFLARTVSFPSARVEPT